MASSGGRRCCATAARNDDSTIDYVSGASQTSQGVRSDAREEVYDSDIEVLVGKCPIPRLA